MSDDAQPNKSGGAATASYGATTDAGGEVGDQGSATLFIGHGDAARAKSRSLRDRVLGDFVLQDVLGNGGFGTVYRAEQRSLGRPVVVKVIHRARRAQRGAVERFAREARLASRFDHPYAAHVYAYGIESDGLTWIAMELVDGTPLGQLVSNAGPLSTERFIPLFERLCDVVQSAHDQGIVHRDIKPSNVMVIERAGRLMPKLLDFGIAKLLDDARAPATSRAPLERAASPAGSPGATPATRELTYDGQLLGSPAYMAPEQWDNPVTAGPFADQYALALLAYEALTGTRAFAGATIAALMEQHRDAPLPVQPTHLSPEVHAVLVRATDKQPERRFVNVTELASALRGAALGAPSIPEQPSGDVDAGSPYPGLAAYTAAEHASFIGREHEVAEVLDRLDTEAIITVVGPSGSGKSSFLAAGVTPSLGTGWHGELIRPGSDPVGALAALISRSAGPRDRFAICDELGQTPRSIAAAIVDLAASRGDGLVVIVDQAEELFTMCQDEDRRSSFAEALVVATASSRVRVLLALRDDFLCRVEQLPPWRGLLCRALYVLGIPRRADLERMISVPARRHGFWFDDPELPREIADEVADRPGALPLVAFTLAQLWDRRDLGLRRLTRDAYEQIGGVTGALVRHADGVVDRMSISDQRQARLVFRRLITPGGARAQIGRTELEDSLAGRSAGTVVDRLLAARLIVSHDDDDAGRIEIIHEVLATAWPRLTMWRREDAEGARFQDQLTIVARHWEERNRPADLLWRGDALTDLRRWRARTDHGMTPVEAAFARACIAAAGRARRNRMVGVVLIMLVLVAGIVGLLAANREIAGQRVAAIQRLSASFEERGRTALADGDDARAMLYLAEASRLGAHGPAFDLLTSRAVVSLGAELEIVGHSPAGFMAMELGAEQIVTLGADYTLSSWGRAGGRTHLADDVAYLALMGDLTAGMSQRGDAIAVDLAGRVRWRAPRAAAVATAGPFVWPAIAGAPTAGVVLLSGDTTTLRDAATGRIRGELPHTQHVTAVAFDSDGEHAATGDATGVARIWNTSTAALVTVCEPHAGAVRTIRFAASKRWIVTGSSDGEVRVCDAATGVTLHHLIGHSQPVVAVDVSPDDRLIVSGSRDGKARIWDARSGLLIRVLEGHRGTVAMTQFSPDGERVLTVAFDGVVRIWGRDGSALGSLQGPAGQALIGRWDLDGHHVITAGVDGAIRRWDPERAIRTTMRHAHTAAVADLALSPDDRWVLTAGADGLAVLWDRRSLQPITRLAHKAKVHSAMIAPSAASALTADVTGVVRLWQLPAGTMLAELGTRATAVTYTRDGQIITADGGRIRFWTATGGEGGWVPVAYTVSRLTLDPSGQWLFVQGASSSVLVIDVAARAPVTVLGIDGDPVAAIASDGRRVVVGGGAVIRSWQVGTWLPLGAMVGHKSDITGLWLLPQGKLISASLDATLVWERDGRLAGKLADTNRIFALATSSDRSWFATTSSDGAIRIWDAENLRLLVQLPGHRLHATTLALTHDGSASVSGGNDGQLIAWDLRRRTRSASELAAIVKCRVPLRISGEITIPRDLDFEDPACRSLVLE